MIILIYHSGLMISRLWQKLLVGGFPFTIDLTHFSAVCFPFLESRVGEFYRPEFVRMQTHQQAL